MLCEHFYNAGRADGDDDVTDFRRRSLNFITPRSPITPTKTLPGDHYVSELEIRVIVRMTMIMRMIKMRILMFKRMITRKCGFYSDCLQSGYLSVLEKAKNITL